MCTFFTSCCVFSRHPYHTGRAIETIAELMHVVNGKWAILNSMLTQDMTTLQINQVRLQDNVCEFA